MLLYYLRHFHKPEIYGKGYAGLIKQGFYESPYVAITCVCFPLPFLIVPYILYRFDKLDAAGKRHTARYTIYRPGHPHLKYFTQVNDRTKVSKEQ